MTFEIMMQIFLLGIALSMDAFAVSVTDGLIYQDINKKKGLFIACLFGLMQGLMPLIGYFLVELVTIIAGSNASDKVGKIMATIVTLIAFFLLLFIGVKMIIEGSKELKVKKEDKVLKFFSYKEVLYFSFATAIDALGAGVALHSGLSTNSTIWLHIAIIIVCTFILSLIGVFLGNKVEKMFKGKVEITTIIGGVILVVLAIWIVLSHFLGI